MEDTAYCEMCIGVSMWWKWLSNPLIFADTSLITKLPTKKCVRMSLSLCVWVLNQCLLHLRWWTLPSLIYNALLFISIIVSVHEKEMLIIIIYLLYMPFILYDPVCANTSFVLICFSVMQAFNFLQVFMK